MNTNILCDISRNLLGAWYLDLEFLVNLLEEYKIDIDEIMESIECNYGKDYVAEFNTIVYEVFNKIATDFIAEHEELFEDNSDEFEIFTNYLDSHLRFESDVVQEQFESLK